MYKPAILLLTALVGLIGCDDAPSRPAAAPPPQQGAAKDAPTAPPEPEEVKMSPPLDVEAVAAATGIAKPEHSDDGVIKVNIPRTDVAVVVDGSPLPPFLGLTSWAAFAPGRAGVAEAMVMGDFVLFEDEVNPVMSELFAAGLQVTALHNHFFYDKPAVYFMHIAGEGTVAALGNGVRRGLETVKTLRTASATPATGFGGPPRPANSELVAAELEAVLGVKGTAKDGMFKVVVGRTARAACGCPIGKTMGVNTWAGFAGTAADAVVDGDFAVAEGELQAVLTSLRGDGINVVAIHHHMTGETPRILFLHYWGRGKAVELASAVRRALDKTDWVASSK
jgi:hypothetical protein